MWTRKQFEEAAQKIGQAFVASKGEVSINDLSVKVAQEGQLAPDGIRTVVRLANVAAFEEMFQKEGADKSEDRMIDFVVGDPEAVITRLHTAAKEAHSTEKVAAYSPSLDYFADIPRTREPLEKNAQAIPGVEVKTSPDKLPSRQEIARLFKRAEDQMLENKRQAAANWSGSLEKVARLLVAHDGRVSARTEFEKSAAGTLGGDILPELRMVQTLTSPKDSPICLFGGEKIAEILDKHITSVSAKHKPIIGMLKEAKEARDILHKNEAGLKWLAENREKVS